MGISPVGLLVDMVPECFHRGTLLGDRVKLARVFSDAVNVVRPATRKFRSEKRYNLGL